VTVECALRPRQRAWLDRSVDLGENFSLLLDVSAFDQPQTYATTNHDVIRQWAIERNAHPAMLTPARRGVVHRRLDLAFAGDREEGLQRIEWEHWFDAFVASRLTFFYRTHRRDGVRSLYFRIA
jgi:hypothetical protein